MFELYWMFWLLEESPAREHNEGWLALLLAALVVFIGVPWWLILVRRHK